MTKKYETKVSYTMLVVILFLFFTPLILGTIDNGIHKEFYILIAILIPASIIILSIFLGTEYMIENDALKIKCGFLYKKSINIHEIKTISKTDSLMSSPAPSFDRIEITYGKFDAIIISPKDKFTLAKDLTLINQNIKNHITEN